MTFVSVLVQDIAGPTGKILICRREQDGNWELPNGKARTNETPERFVSRIAWEELGVELTFGKLQMRGRKVKPETMYDFHEYYDGILMWEKEPKNDTYCEMKWVHPSLLGNYEFDGDDKVFISKYVAWVTGDVICGCRM